MTYRSSLTKSDLDMINDEPFGFMEEDPGIFLVRLAGKRMPFGVFVAEDMEQLYWQVDEIVDPGVCECSVMLSGEGFFLNSDEAATLSESAEAVVRQRHAWRPVDDGTVERKRKAERLVRLEEEAADLTNIFKGLKRKVYDKPDGHRRRSPKNAVPVEEARRG